MEPSASPSKTDALKANKSENRGDRSPLKSARSRGESERSLSIGKEEEGEPILVDESNAVYQSAMKKLVDASWKYDREKDGPFLRQLENTQLDKEFLRTTLVKGLNCKLNPEEFDALLPLFKNGDKVDGCEFTCLFYRLRFEFRSKLLSSRIAQDQHKKSVALMEAKEKAAKIEEKKKIKLNRNYSEADFESAMDKLTEAAYKYDRLMPGAVQLDAFDCEKMRPEVFREQVKRAFHINLTIPELEALFDFLAKDDEGEAVMCANFLVQFFRLGFQERSRRLKLKFEEKRRIEKEREEKKLKELEELEKKNALKCTYEFTAEEKERALMKLREAARLYDKTTPGAMSMKAFEVASMPPHVFKEQLKRIFNLQVTPAELGALMKIFDVDGDGDVTCEEFSKTFLAMGFAERERELKMIQAKQKAAEKARAAAQKRKEDELAAKNARKFTFEFAEKDFESGLAKLTEAAFRYDKNMPGAPNLVAFDRLLMEPHDFKEQLHRAFTVQITPPELGALLTYFNADEKGNITCSQFLIKFFKLGFQERQRRRAQWMEYERSVEEQRKKEAEGKQIKAAKKLLLKVEEFTEEEFQSAFSKLTNAAVKYENNSFGAKLLAAFEAESMLPHVFREQLKIALKIRLTTGELSALMSYFDREGKGFMFCKDFIVEFYRTGLEERDRIRASWRQEQREYEERLKKTQEESERHKAVKSMAEVNYEFTEEDFDIALKKLVTMSRLFDTRQLGPGGFNSFTVDALTPSEFKEMLRRTFNVKVTPPQLGAMTTYFDPSVKGTVSCSTFISTFLKIRVKCEAFKGRTNEKELVAEFTQQLKEGYKEKVQQILERTKDMDLRPWRMYRHKKKGAQQIREHHPYPETAIAKLRLRIQVARKSGLLDLSTKACWPEDDAEEESAHEKAVSGSGSAGKVLRGGGKEPPASSSAAYSDSELEIRKNEQAAEADEVAAGVGEEGHHLEAEAPASVPAAAPAGDDDEAQSPPQQQQQQHVVEEQEKALAAAPTTLRKKVIDATDEDRKNNAAIAVETAVAVGQLTLASAFVQGEAVVRKITATGLPRLDVISSIGGKQNPFIRMSLKSTGERAFSPVLIDPGSDCSWELLDLYLGGAFIAAKRMQRFRGASGGRKGLAAKNRPSTGSLTAAADAGSTTLTSPAVSVAPLGEEVQVADVEHVLEVEVLNDSIIIPDVLIGIASAPLPNVPIGSIRQPGSRTGDDGDKFHCPFSGAHNDHTHEEAVGMAQWRLELSLDLTTSSPVDTGAGGGGGGGGGGEGSVDKPAGSLRLEVEVPAASDNIPDSVVTIKAGTITVNKVNVYNLEYLACTDGSVSKDSPPSYIVLSIGDDEWKVTTEVKNGKLLVLDIPSAQNAVSPVLTNKAFLHRRLNVALMRKRDPSATISSSSGSTAAADVDVAYGAAGAGTAVGGDIVESESAENGGGADNVKDREEGIVRVAGEQQQQEQGEEQQQEQQGDVLVAQGSMSLRGAAYQEGQTAFLSLLLKDASGAPVSRVSINVQVDRASLPVAAAAAADEEEITAATPIPIPIDQHAPTSKVTIPDNNKGVDITNNKGVVITIPDTTGGIKRTLSRSSSRRKSRMLKGGGTDPNRRRHSTDTKQAMKKALQLRQAEGRHVDYRLRTIPDEVFAISNLRELWLTDNIVSTIPSEIGDLKQLKILSLTRNDLERLPPEISMLDRLQKLYLGGNCLSSLPDLFFKLRQLEELDLSGNEFTVVPHEILGLTQLIHLNLSENLLTGLPEGLRKLHNLVTLDLRFNHFGDSELTVLSDMAWVQVLGVKLPDPKVVHVPKRFEAFLKTPAGRSLPGSFADHNQHQQQQPQQNEVPEEEASAAVITSSASSPSSPSSSSSVLVVTVTKAAEPLKISRDDEWEFEGFLRRRAKMRSAGKITSKLRRRKATRSPPKLSEGLTTLDDRSSFYP